MSEITSEATSTIGVPTIRIAAGMDHIRRTKPTESIRTVFQTGGAGIAVISIARQCRAATADARCCRACRGCNLLLLERQQYRPQAHALHHSSLAIDMKPCPLTVLCRHHSSSRKWLSSNGSAFEPDTLCAIAQGPGIRKDVVAGA